MRTQSVEHRRCAVIEAWIFEGYEGKADHVSKRDGFLGKLAPVPISFLIGDKGWSTQSDRYEIITDHNKLLSLKPYWDDLYERSTEHDLTQSFEWCRCSLEIVAEPRCRRLNCLVVWRHDRAVLIWPFVTYRRFLETVARPLGPATTEYSSVLVEEGREADLRLVSAWGVLRKNLRADQILLPFVRRGSALHRGLVASKIAARVQVWPTSYVSWEEHQDWESYCRVLKRDFRAELRRTRRRLNGLGNLTFEAINDSARFSVILTGFSTKRQNGQDWSEECLA